jgi:hypothetical protein
VVNILPIAIFPRCVDSWATIANALLVPLAVASGLRVAPYTGLAFGGAVAFGSGANGASAQRPFLLISTSRATEVWLDICELQERNPAGSWKTSWLLGKEGLDRIPNCVKREQTNISVVLAECV